MVLSPAAPMQSGGWRGVLQPFGGGFLQDCSQAERVLPPGSEPPVFADVEELWIGLNDLKLQMNFEWSDGTPVRFTYWHPFEPNNFRDSLEDCVTIWGPVRAQGRKRILYPYGILVVREEGPGGVSPAWVEPGSSKLLGGEGSSAYMGDDAGKEISGVQAGKFPRAVSWAQSCTSPPFPGREME